MICKIGTLVLRCILNSSDVLVYVPMFRSKHLNNAYTITVRWLAQEWLLLLAVKPTTSTIWFAIWSEGSSAMDLRMVCRVGWMERNGVVDSIDGVDDNY
jgi:hypothetical protein